MMLRNESETPSTVAPLRNKTVFFTIVSRNYLSFASVLVQSLNLHHPDVKVCIWLLDEGEYPPIDCKACFRNVREVFDSDQLDSLRIYYDVLELATSVKPHLIKAHLSEGADRVIYLDPDIAVFQPLEQVFALLDKGASAVFTPHITQPLPQDGHKPDDLEILTSGTYNLGFLAVAACPEVLDFLSWWDGWLKTHCFSDKSKGIFTDQKWAEFGISLLKEAKVLHDPSCNVAYWNLHYRKLAQSQDGWTVNGRHLGFFHFSGFNPKIPGSLSKHQDRFSISQEEPVAKLLGWYAGQVRSANYETIRKLPFPDAHFSNGVKVDICVRREFQKLTLRGKKFGAPLDAKGAFYQWLLRPASVTAGGEKPAITNYLAGLYEMRPDVRQAYPDWLGQHKQFFLDWVRGSGCMELRLSKTLVFHGLETVPEKKPESAQLKSDGRAVTYFGYLGSRLGIGEAARGNIGGLRAQGLEVHAINISHLSASETGEWDCEPKDGETPLPDSKINLIHVNPDQLLTLQDGFQSAFMKRRYNIGVWAWETLKFPTEWMDRFALLDEIWVGGSFMGKAIAEVSPVPVIHMPHVVRVPQAQADRKRFGIPNNETVFLFMFDFFSTTARKNPEAIIEAFRKAFSPNDPVRLFMKSMNGANKEEFVRLQELAQGLKVSFLDRALNGEERFVLIASCDVFISLHRAEGFGLCMAEAMAMGKPVIATGWSGNMDFMNINNSLPVGFELKELEEDSLPYRAGTLWAEADTNHAAELMRKVWQDPAMAGKIGARARRDLEKNFSEEAIGEKMVARLNLLSQGLQTQPEAADNVAAMSQVLDTQSMNARYQLLKMFRQGQLTWEEFLDNSGGYGNISTFAARLPGYWAARTVKRFQNSISKRLRMELLLWFIISVTNHNLHLPNRQIAVPSGVCVAIAAMSAVQI